MFIPNIWIFDWYQRTEGTVSEGWGRSLYSFQAQIANAVYVSVVMYFTESKRRLSFSTLSGLVLPDPTVHNPVIQIPSHRSSFTSTNLFVTTTSQHGICPWLEHKDRVPYFLRPLSSFCSLLKWWPQGNNFYSPSNVSSSLYNSVHFFYEVISSSKRELAILFFVLSFFIA